MHKQIRSCTSYPGTRTEAQDLFGEYSASPPPEISIFPAAENRRKPLEIDEYTGLPKLPVELPLPGSPEAVRSQADLKKVSQQLASALKMTSSVSPLQRKSVTFDPAATSESDSPKYLAMSKQSSDGSVVLRDQIKQVKRANGRPTSLPNRSRSVFIRLLQPPRGTTTPTAHHKYSAGNEPLTPVESDLSNARTDEAASPVISRVSPGRRSSFLYQQGSDSREDGGRFLGGGDYVTPFAQILSTLHHVRADYLALVGFPEDTKTAYTRQASAPALSPSQDRKFPKVPDRKAALEVLQDLDWSLKMLETVNSNQSMGNVTGDKIKRLLNRELSHLSEGSENGAQVAEWVTNITSSDPYDVERMLSSANVRSNEATEMESVLSKSHSHDNWTRRLRAQRVPGRRITMEAESVPKFGVDVSEENRKEMEEYMEKKLHCWSVDVFRFSTISEGNPLVSASYILFKRRNLFSELHISPHSFINYMSTIQNSYHSANAYHNAMHATDVMLTTNQLISADSLDGVFSQVEVMAALVAAAVHDVDHPGVTNPYLVAIRHELAVMYNDSSVLENHHVATAFRTLQKPKCNFLEHLDSDCVQLYRRAVIDMVLSTDMAKHIGNVADMKTLMETKKLTNDGLLSLGNYKENSAVLKCLIHCADLSNPTKDPALASNWSYRIMEESFKQGDREKELGIAVHAMGDRDAVCIPKCQTTFIDLIIYPLWETWAELVYPDAQHVMDSLAITKAFWCKLAAKEEGDSPKILGNSHDSGDGEGGPPESLQILGNSEGGGPPEPVSGKSSSSASGVAPSSANAGVVSPSNSGEGGDSLSLNDSADSATLEAEFERSPASERRISYRSIKETPMGQGISSSLQDS